MTSMCKLIKTVCSILCIFRTLGSVFGSQEYYDMIEHILRNNVNMIPESNTMETKYAVRHTPYVFNPRSPPSGYLGNVYYPASWSDRMKVEEPVNQAEEKVRTIKTASGLKHLFATLKAEDELERSYEDDELNRYRDVVFNEVQKRNKQRRNTLFDTFMNKMDDVDDSEQRGRAFNSWSGRFYEQDGRC